MDTVIGDLRMTGGLYEGTGASGSFRTGLQKTAFVKFTPKGAAAPDTQFAVTTALPTSDAAIEVAHTADADCYWRAFGY